MHTGKICLSQDKCMSQWKNKLSKTSILNNNTPRPGGVVAKLIKSGAIALLERIKDLLNHCLEQQKTTRMETKLHIVITKEGE